MGASACSPRKLELVNVFMADVKDTVDVHPFLSLLAVQAHQTRGGPPV